MKKAVSLLLIAAVTSFAGGAYAYSIHLPESLKAIEEQAFKGDHALEKVVLPSGLERIEGEAFASTSINSLYAEDISRVSIAENAFDGKTLFLFPMEEDTLVIASGGYGQITFSQYPPRKI